VKVKSLPALGRESKLKAPLPSAVASMVVFDGAKCSLPELLRVAWCHSPVVPILNLMNTHAAFQLAAPVLILQLFSIERSKLTLTH
jgi:hypothetical protein